MKALLSITLLLFPMIVLAEEPAPAPVAEATAATGYRECSAVSMWIVSGRVANSVGIPENNIVTVPEGWELVNVVANTKSPLMIVCR